MSAVELMIHLVVVVTLLMAHAGVFWRCNGRGVHWMISFLILVGIAGLVGLFFIDLEEINSADLGYTGPGGFAEVVRRSFGFLRGSAVVAAVYYVMLKITASAAAEDAGRCRRCGYLLRGLPENRCPECGTEFDPAMCKSQPMFGGEDKAETR